MPPIRLRAGSPWTGLGTVVAKETADHLSSVRMRILEALVFLTAVAAAYAAIRSIRETIGESPFLFLRLLTLSKEPLPAFIALLGFLIPLVAIALGFDAINGEFNRTDVALDDDGHEPVADLLAGDDRHIGGLDHGIGRSERRDVALGFDHPDCVVGHDSSWFVRPPAALPRCSDRVVLMLRG